MYICNHCTFRIKELLKYSCMNINKRIVFEHTIPLSGEIAKVNANFRDKC